MGVLRIDHPDILEFINAKRQPGRWTHFNVSVAVSDDFIAALGRGDRWPLWHRVPPREGTAYARTRHPTEDGWLYACLPATELWDALLRASFETSEPGVLFMDRIERDNNLRSIESILATNPCITGDTWVTTDHGRVKASDLVGRSFNAVVGGQTWPSGASGFVSKGIQPVLELRSSQGHRLRLTAHHRVRRLRPTPQDASEAAWTPADQLECGDLIVVEDNGVSQSDHPETTSVRSLRPCGLAPVFDVSIPGIEAFVANSLLVHNCGEQPLPAYGACDLGPLILPRFVRHPFGQGGTPEFEFDRFEASVALQVRALDNVLELTLWPLPQQRLEARSKRRIGVGFTGLADALIMMGLRYDLEPGRTMAARIARSMSHAAYRASVDLARDRGPFPLFDAATYLSEGTFASRLPEGLRAQIRKNGIRNSHVLSIAPTGSVSIALADNCASGIEPVFAWRQRRTVHGPDGRRRIRTVENHAWRRYRALGGDLRRLPEAFVRADEIDARSHIAMIASVQPFIDGSISKTVNLPRGFSFESYRRIYLDAWNAGLKGLATWRPESLRGTVIEPARDREGVKQAPAPELRIDRIRTCPT
jgi:ribonucleotide reductase alpha subunit